MKKEFDFRYTSHEWYSVARSFIIFGMAFTLLMASSGVIMMINSAWLNQTSSGNIVQAAIAGICILISARCGFVVANKLFERAGKLAYDGKTITLHLGKKTTEVELTRISEIEKSLFSSFTNTNRLKSKITGPLYVQYTVITDKNRFPVCSSAGEGWEKTKAGLMKGAFKPAYTIDAAFEALAEEAKIKIVEY